MSYDKCIILKGVFYMRSGILFLVSLFSFSTYSAADFCEQIRAVMIATIDAGATSQVVSKSADQLYHHVSTGGQGSRCKYVRYSFRTLRKPYNGDKVSPKDWDKAIQNLRNRKEY
jgi:hypothetical protein